MKFRFAARVIAQLGAELISSDDIAVYELIKNAFDAGADRVKIEIRYHVAVSDVARVQETIRRMFKEKAKLPAVRQAITDEVERLAPIGPALAESLEKSKSVVVEGLSEADEEGEFVTLVGGLNQITISDTGHGMDQVTLQDCFLTIGTTNRLKQHEAITDHQVDDPDEATVLTPYDPAYARPPAGEKGIGRLSAMRLGNDLQVRTWTVNADEQNLLTIDWRVFSPDSSLEADEIEIPVETLPRSEDNSPSGSVLSITDLQSSWDHEKTTNVAAKFLSRFFDPFASSAHRAVEIVWNGTDVEIPIMARRYLEASHNGMKGKLTVDKDRRFSLTIDYWFRKSDTGERKILKRTYSSADFGGLTDAAIADVGGFSFELYHYNRLRVTAITGFATRVEFKRWLDEWAGGLMLYRDGLRVMPYGRMPDDDWLELDRYALRRSGFRVNRIQIVGCVRISRQRNPLLKDQTNREGLRDNAAATTFRRLLQKIIQQLFVPLLDKEARPEGRTDEDLISRSVDIQSAVDSAVDRLATAAEEADLHEVAHAKKELKAALESIPIIANDLRDAVANHALQRVEVLELAATGMTAMSLAHDLEAALDEASSETGTLSRSGSVGTDLRGSLNHLVALFKSLRTLVTEIKPGPAQTRRRKSTFAIGDVVEQLKTFYAARQNKDGIRVAVNTRPPSRPFRIKAVEGHVRQVIDNLFRNAMYWLVDTRSKHPEHAPSPLIEVVLDHKSKTMVFRDTGVGIAPHDAEWIFEAFTTHREGGHGLGLYISKELCKFNGITIGVDTTSMNQWRRHDKIVLDFSDCYLEEDK